MSTRPLLMIPGPIEIEAGVQVAMARGSLSHLDPEFMQAFSRVLTRSRDVFGAPTGQPFVIAGSGTLAMEMAAANLVERGDAALVIDTGFFGDRMARILERHGATVTRVGGVLGAASSIDEVSAALASSGATIVTITHVDTSTGVLAPVREYAALARERGALVIVDGVCSVGGEDLRMDEWGVDLALTASQKALGAPPGLAVLVAGPRAMEKWRARKTPVGAFYVDFGEWLPVMEAYEHGRVAYFGTPPVQLIAALDASLASLVAEGMDTRCDRHRRIAHAFRSAWTALELQMLPINESVTAHTLSAVYYPQGVDAALVARVREHGVVIAGGLHPAARTKYFRVGHMGSTGLPEILTTVGAVERALAASGWSAAMSGRGVAAAEKAW